MLTINVPEDLAGPLSEEAERRGTTPELLALEGVRKMLPHDPPSPLEGTLLDFLKPYVGTVDGSGEAYSQDCGRRFAEGLAAKHRSTSP